MTTVPVTIKTMTQVSSLSGSVDRKVHVDRIHLPRVLPENY